MNKVLLVCAAIAGASLYFIYALSAYLFLNHLELASITLLEAVIIITQVVRLAGIVAYFGMKPARLEVLLVLLSLETFLVMGLIVIYLISPAPYYSSLAHSIFSTWVAALFIVLPSYLIFTGVTQMTQNRNLIAILVSLTLEFGFLTFAASSMLGFSGTFTFANFFDFLIGAAKFDLGAGTIPFLDSYLILVPSAAVYLALLVYVTIPTSTSVVPPKVTFVLPLLGAVVALGWVYASVIVVPNTLLSFTLSGIIVVALLWAYMRR
jgi:hypothetical protein